MCFILSLTIFLWLEIDILTRNTTDIFGKMWIFPSVNSSSVNCVTQDLFSHSFIIFHSFRLGSQVVPGYARVQPGRVTHHQGHVKDKQSFTLTPHKLEFLGVHAVFLQCTWHTHLESGMIFVQQGILTALAGCNATSGLSTIIMVYHNYRICAIVWASRQSIILPKAKCAIIWSFCECLVVVIGKTILSGVLNY